MYPLEQPETVQSFYYGFHFKSIPIIARRMAQVHNEVEER